MFHGPDQLGSTGPGSNLLIGGGPTPAQSAMAGSEETQLPLDASTTKLTCNQCRTGLKAVNEGNGASMSRLMTINFCSAGADQLSVGTP